ncbi:4-diphosphocytidyl-2-C-methyl-D-erythritol kinase, partial [mine drainage metagenome]
VDVPAAEDLAVRAAQALQVASGSVLGADIALDKRIPQGGGLGGGSSDAATVLRALNLIWGCALDVDHLARLGLRLGADVPVFVRGANALAEGVGEVLTPLVLTPAWYVIVAPGVAVPTAPLFQAPELTRDAAPETIARLSCGTARGNAFEPVVRARYPAVAAALDWLGGLSAARLSGSGACIYAELADRASAERIASTCPAPWKAWVVAGAERSPLLAALEDFGKV